MTTIATITIKFEIEDPECEGHESLAGEHMGEAVYCDGTCVRFQTKTLVSSLENLAAVMYVQAEDGLFTLGSPDAETEDGPSEYVCDLEFAGTPTVTLTAKES